MGEESVFIKTGQTNCTQAEIDNICLLNLQKVSCSLKLLGSFKFNERAQETSDESAWELKTEEMR